MLTLYYVVTDANTFPLREGMKAHGCRFDYGCKLWWADQRTAAVDAAAFVSAEIPNADIRVEARHVDALPKAKPRGRPFKRGADARREGASYNGDAHAQAMVEAAEAEEQAYSAATAVADADDDDQPRPTDNAAEQLANAVRALAVGQVDRKQVEEIVSKQTAFISRKMGELAAEVLKLQGSAVTRVVVERPNVEPRDCGVQHCNFPILLRACNARTPDGHRLNVWLVGPAGSGKTTAAVEVAKALGLAFWSNGALASKYELLGFADANGRTHRTPFREAWEFGGVFLWDEIDGSDNNAVLAFNQGLANGVIPFPDGMVPRHPDCVILAGANSSNGGTANYNGRIRQDGAFLDRFVYLEWPLDEALETAIAPDAAWCKRVQAVRATAASRGVQGHLVTPRATVYGAALLAAGLDQATVETMVLRKALTDDQWAQVRGGK